MADTSSALAQGQVPDQTLAAGELLLLKCPAGSKILAKENQSFPDGNPQPDYKIISINGETVAIGFLKGGSFKIELPCSNEQKISSTVLLKTLEPNEQPEAVPPLDFEALAYPLWIWIALALLLASPLFYYFYRKSKLRQVLKTKLTRAQPLSPSEKLEKYLREFSAQSKKQKDFSPQETKTLFSQGYTHFRNFLDQRFKINASHETTREFVGTLRSTAQLWNLALQDVALIDALLTTADNVRFASDNPDSQVREKFLKDIYDFYKKFQIQEVQVSEKNKA